MVMWLGENIHIALLLSSTRWGNKIKTDVIFIRNRSKINRKHNISFVFIQEECYRLILAKGGNHDLQDINGCTVTHILTIYNNMRVTCPR